MKKILFTAFVIAAAVCALPGANYSQDSKGEEVKLYMGQIKLITTSNPQRIVVGNPAIADVVQVSKNEITLSPKSPGTTSFAYWDNYGEQSYILKVFAEDMIEVKRRVDNALSKLNLRDISTKAEEDEGKIYLLGKVKTKEEKDRMSLVLGPLKDKTVDLVTIKEEETVLEMDVQVLELAKGASSDLGFTWPGAFGPINITDASNPVTNAVGFAQVWTMNAFTRGALSFSWKLDTLIQEGKARILSRPRLSTQSCKEAKLLVGGEVPVLSSTLSQGGSVGTTPSATPGTVEYKEYGITLKIKPCVEENRRIHLNLFVEVSELGDTVKTDYALAYTFTKRNATTELYLNDGETMAIGGLIKQKDSETLRKFPWLADLPVLGLFFRKKSTMDGGGSEKREDAELFITLTPHIVAEPKPATELKKDIKPNIPAAVEDEMLDPVSRYSRIIQDRILERLMYPATAKSAGFQGTTVLGLKFSFRGELQDSVVKRSSGYKILDDNALAVAKGIPTYPPFPSTIEDKELWINVPIIYQLD